MASKKRADEDKQAEIADLRAHAEAILAALGCETEEDFDANLDEVLASAKTLITETKELKGAE